MLETLLETPLYLVYFVLALGVLVFVHELGHFLVAKRAGIRVDRFSLGFPPKMVGVQVGETEYCLSWIPFGGYVKVAGMADVGEDAATGAPWEYPSKPVWVRMAVIFAGPAMNFIFAFFAFAFISLYFGAETYDSTTVQVTEASVAVHAGLEHGDRIVTVEGQAVTNSYELARSLEAAASGAQLEVERDGRLLAVDLPPAPADGYGLSVLVSTVVGSLSSDMPAESIGLLRGDRIVSVGGEPVSDWSQMSTAIRKHPGETITIEWDRDGTLMSSPITPQPTKSEDQTIGLIGIGPYTSRAQVPFGEALAAGAGAVWRSSLLIFDFLRQLTQGDRSAEELGGPLRIAQMAKHTADQGLLTYLSFLALLSVNLAVLNLLPIPVLDGGHLTFLTLEAIMRRPLSTRQRELSQQVGLAIMLCVMVLVTFNDLNQMVFHHIANLFR